MIPNLLLLAQTGGANENSASMPAMFSGLSIDRVWDLIVQVSWMQAIFAVAFGVIYLIYGWRVFRVLVVINFAILGVFAGRYMGALLGSGMWGAILGCLILGTVAWPFMKYAVSVLGALAGAVIGLALCRSIGLPDQVLNFGVLIGVICGGFLAFSSFKMSIMLFTSLQGSGFLVIGVMALLNAYPSFGLHLTSAVMTYHFLLPMLVIIPTVVGIIMQFHLLQHESEWAMPE